jgi:hypothetical protein
MNDEIQQKLKWIKLYQVTNNLGLVCLRCGISRLTLAKWRPRYQKIRWFKQLKYKYSITRQSKNFPSHTNLLITAQTNVL